MRKVIYLLTVILFLCGCHKEEGFHYRIPLGGLQFDQKSMTLDYDFSFIQNEEGRYLGDSIQFDTLRFAVTLVGYCADHDRPFVLDTTLVTGQDSSQVARVTFLPPYRLKAGCYKDTVRVVLHRPAVRGKYTVGVTFDWDAVPGEFEKGVKEKLVFRINVTDSYPEPANWNDKYFGEYSEEKYAFYVTVIGDRFENFEEADGTRYNRLLHNALKAYKEEHPDEPKDFSFPENI